MTEPQKLMVPDAILKHLSCSCCNKYLSVFPVKAYNPGQVIKCGRCSYEGDRGKYSMYNQLIEEHFFPCINRYEGCRKALRHFEVLEHELACRPRTRYDCPLCISSTDLSILQLLVHFRKVHSDNVLLESRFILNNRTSYIHSTQFNVFQISVTKPNDNDVKIRVKALGHEKYIRHISVTFDLPLEYTKVETDHSNLFEIDVPLSDKLQENWVEVEFKVHCDGILYNDFHFSPIWYPDSDSTCEFLSHELLETLSCTICKRHLSVTPVKLYAGEVVKCGRCSVDGDEGTPSLYNKLIEALRFPGTNKYDTGSTEDLRSFEVVAHEKNCRNSIKYKCPICTTLQKLNAYETLIHFKQYHANNVLKKQKILLNCFTSYLYYNEFHVFMIQIVPFKSQYIKIAVRVLGYDIDDVRITFHMKQKFSEIETENSNVYAGTLSRFLAEKTEVTFDIHYNKDRIRYAPNWCPFHGFIRLSTYFRKNYPSYIYSEDTYAFKGTDADKLIQIYCKRCRRRYGSSLNYDNLHAIYVCDNCAFAENSCRSETKEKIVNDKACSEMYGALGVKCRYGCNGIFNLVSYVQLKHEDHCDRRPLQKCPVKFCIWQYKLSSLEWHFGLCHPKTILTETNTFTFDELFKMCQDNIQVFIKVDDCIFHLALVLCSGGEIFVTSSRRDSDDKCDLETRNSTKRLQHSKRVYLSANEYLVVPQSFI